MLVSFKFECFKHGEFEYFYNTIQYPNRDFPLFATMCQVEKNCHRIATYIPSGQFAKDTIADGKVIESLGVYAKSKDWLKRYLRTNGISQLTSDEIGGHKSSQKTKKERINEHLNKPEVVRERTKTISKILDDNFGVIDGVKNE